MDDMFLLILLIFQTIYLYLPALIANMIPVLVKTIPILNYPVDFGLKLGKKRILGAHKTFRGLFFAVIAAMLIALLQKYLYQFDVVKMISVIDYSSVNLLWIMLFGALLGFGALVGDMIESFFKRRVNIKPGKPWIPFDQIDFILGATLFMLILYTPLPKIILTMLIIGFILHVFFNRMGYWLKIKKSKW